MTFYPKLKPESAHKLSVFETRCRYESTLLRQCVLLCAQCSVTCGPGEQTREVACVGSAGTLLEEPSCGALLRPAAVRPCETASCLRQIGWHVGDWGLVRRRANGSLVWR